MAGVVASPPLSFSWLQARLVVGPFLCEYAGVLRGEGLTDPKYPDDPVPDIHSFMRRTQGRKVFSEINVYHEGLPIPEKVVRVFLRKLGIELEELL